MLASRRLLSAPAVQSRYDKRRKLNVTERAGTLKPTVLLRSTLFHMKTVTAGSGED
jgi:hypothetical protein